MGATMSATPLPRITKGASAPPRLFDESGAGVRRHSIHAATRPNASQIINDAVAWMPAPVAPRRVHNQAAAASGAATRSKVVANTRGLFRAKATTVWIPYQR